MPLSEHPSRNHRHCAHSGTAYSHSSLQYIQYLALFCTIPTLPTTSHSDCALLTSTTILILPKRRCAITARPPTHTQNWGKPGGESWLLQLQALLDDLVDIRGAHRFGTHLIEASWLACSAQLRAVGGHRHDQLATAAAARDQTVRLVLTEPQQHLQNPKENTTYSYNSGSEGKYCA
jgi:hypothetical protein